MKKTIGVVTVARSDYGIYRPILQEIYADSDLTLKLFVSGMHLSHEFGLTVQEIEADPFDIAEKIETILSSDSPVGIAKSIGLGVLGFAEALERTPCDLLLVLGDRFEMFAAATSAIPHNVAIAHIHGGELTEGAIDEVMRHSISKMSHLHFVSTERYKQRLIQMGEAPWRVTVSGAPGLDNVKAVPLLSQAELAADLGISLDPPPLLITFHPVTRTHEETEYHISELLSALTLVQQPIIFTYPNADTSGRQIIDAIDQYVNEHETAVVFPNLGTQRFFSLMKCAGAMIGNSSSGIIEAASFSLPVVNIGDRQKGRLQGGNIVNCTHDRDAIVEAINEATSGEFRKAICGMTNPYGDGRAANRIVEKLKLVTTDAALLQKRFYDFPNDILENFPAEQSGKEV